MKTILASSWVALGVVCAISACSLFSSPKGPSVVALGVKDAICVIDHDGEPVVQIIKDCGLVGDVAQAVSDILASSHAAEARALAAHGVDAGAVDAGKPIVIYVDAAGLGK